MSKRTWIILTLAVGGAAASPGGVAHAQPQATTASTQPATSPAMSEVEQLADILASADAPQSDRDEAARRLVARQMAGNTSARDRLQQALINVGNPRGQLAVARAIADASDPDPALIIPLGALIGNRVDLTEAAAQALAEYNGNDQARRRLLDAAQDPQGRLVPNARAAVVRALGALPDKRVASVLIALHEAPGTPPPVQSAATEALGDLVGLSATDAAGVNWGDWWEQNRDKTPEQFAADLHAARSAQLQHVLSDQHRMTDELRALLNEQHQSAPDQRKDEVLIRFLRSSEPEVRLVGAQIVRRMFNDNKPIAPAIKERLRAMVGDSAPRVRLVVAGALYDINDPAAVDALLTQLAQETAPSVRAALAAAAARSQDVRAVPPLLDLLNDPSPQVVRTAAVALQQLGPIVRERDQAGARRASERLNETLKRFEAPQFADVREAIVEAMAPLRNEELRGTYTSLLRLNESPAVRRAALRALGEFGTTWAADIIANSGAIEDADASVRLAAIEALGRCATHEHANKFYDRLRDPDEEVQIKQVAWNSLVTLLPRFDNQSLVRWADRYRDEPQRRLAILEVLKRKLINERNEVELANQRLNIGEEHMRLGQYTEAAAEFLPAYEYHRGLDPKGLHTQYLVGQLIEAYLASNDFPNAAAFASAAIANDPGQQPTIGAAILGKVNALRQAGQLDLAIQLVDHARQMDPGLEGSAAEELGRLEREIRSDIAKGEGSRSADPPSAGSEPAGAPLPLTVTLAH